MKKVLLIVCAVICSMGISSAQFKPQPFKWDVKYRGEVNIGGAFSNKINLIEPDELELVDYKYRSALSRPLIETVHGVSLSNYLYVGVGLGFQYYGGKYKSADGYLYFKDDKDSWGTLAIPLFVNIKGFFPINDNLRPFTTLSFGGTIMATSNATFLETETHYDYDYAEYNRKLRGGFYCDWGVGIEYKKWSFGVGLQHQRIAQTADYYGYDLDWDGDVIDEERSFYEIAEGKFNSFYLKVGIIF